MGTLSLMLSTVLSVLSALLILSRLFIVLKWLDTALQYIIPVNLLYPGSTAVTIISFFILAVVIIGLFLGTYFEIKNLSLISSVIIFISLLGFYSPRADSLNGLSFFRFIWLPLAESTVGRVATAHVITIPFNLIDVFSMWMGIDINLAFLTFLSGLGLSIILLIIVARLSRLLIGYEPDIVWVREYSRYPSVLGYILFSYGLLGYILKYYRDVYFVDPGFVWLLSILGIIGWALLNEVDICVKMGYDYMLYRARIPFLIPIPRLVSKLIMYPWTLLRRHARWENGKDIFYIQIVYLTIILLVSNIIDIVLMG